MIETKTNYFVKNSLTAILIFLLIVLLGGCNDSSSDIVNEYNNETSSDSISTDSISTDDNYSFATAESINLETDYNYSISSFSDEDYYSITVEAGSSVSISVTNTTANLDLYTYNDSEEMISSSQGMDDLTIIYSTLTTSTIYIKVKGYWGDISDYTLTVSTTIDTSTYDNNSFSAATPIELDTSYNDSITSFWHTDYYSTTVTAGSCIAISLTNMTDDLDLYIYNSSRELIESSTNHNDNETIYYTTIETSIIYIKVALVSETSDYTLTTMSLTPNPDYNEYFATATPIELDTSYNNSISTYYDRDYYSISAEAGTSINVSITNTTDLLTIYIYNESEDYVVSSYDYYNYSDSINFLASTTGTVYIKIVGHNESISDYTLTVTTTNSPIEHNETFATAIPIDHNTSYDSSILIATDIDKDFYSITIAAGSSVDISLTNTTTSIDLYIYDASENLIESTYETGYDNISYSSTLTSTIYIKVLGYCGTIGDYTLTVTDIQ